MLLVWQFNKFNKTPLIILQLRLTGCRLPTRTVHLAHHLLLVSQTNWVLGGCSLLPSFPSPCMWQCACASQLLPMQWQVCKWLQITGWFGTSDTFYRHRYSTSRIHAKTDLFKPIGKVLTKPIPFEIIDVLIGPRISSMRINTWRENAKKMEPDSFSVVPSDKTRGHGHKLKRRSFPLNIRNDFFTVKMEHRHRLPRDVESISLEIFKSHLDTALGNKLLGGPAWAKELD